MLPSPKAGPFMASRGRRELAEVLLRKAGGDLATVKALLGEEIPDEILGFHAQQAAEKAFKAVLAAREISYKFSHDLAYLIDLIEADGLEVPEAVRATDSLRPWAVEFRYEDPVADSPELDRGQALTLASTAINWATEIVAAVDRTPADSG